MELLLLISIFAIATCGLIYELIAGTLASYLLGDSVTQFSTIIGCYLFAMGIGSWLSRYITRNLLAFFIKVEILVGLIGGSSAALFFVLFEHVYSFRMLLYFVVSIIGILVGIEIPILLRILKEKFEFKDLVSKVFTFDYIGALFASLLFPLVLVPHLGLVQSSFMFGMINTSVALWTLYIIKEPIAAASMHKMSAVFVLIALMFGFIYSEQILNFSENNNFQGKIIYAKSSPYQRIVLTRHGNDIRLFLNSNLQFSSSDEYRYHEALVHPALSALKSPEHILIIGGGDGLALREVLKYDSIKTIRLVDLDPAMTQLFSGNTMLQNLNRNSLHSSKLQIINADAFLWLKEISNHTEIPKFDAIIIDVPDPSNFSVGKLYSTTFFKMLQKFTMDHSIIVVQSTSPFFARKSFWCINNTLEKTGFQTAPYHTYVPSFGEWGFVIASKQTYQMPARYPEHVRYISTETAKNMFHFPDDMAKMETRIQRLDDQVLVRYFDEEWSTYLTH